MKSPREKAGRWGITRFSSRSSSRLERGAMEISEWTLRRVFLPSFEAAMASNPDWLHISTFNELAEFSHIEATFEHGYTYIDLTAEFVRKFKNPE